MCSSDGDAAGGQQRGQLGHLQGVPARRELARVDQPERGARRRRAAGGWECRPASAAAARICRRPRGCCPPGSSGAPRSGTAGNARRRRSARARRRVSGVRPGTDCGTSVRYGHSRPANASLLAAAAVTARPRSTTRSCRCSASSLASSSVAAAGRRRTSEPSTQVLLERPPHGDAGFGQQRRDQPAGADRRLEHQRHRAARPGQRLRHGLQPDGRTIDQVQVDVAVDKRPRGQRWMLLSWLTDGEEP